MNEHDIEFIKFYPGEPLALLDRIRKYLGVDMPRRPYIGLLDGELNDIQREILVKNIDRDVILNGGIQCFDASQVSDEWSVDTLMNMNIPKAYFCQRSRLKRLRGNYAQIANEPNSYIKLSPEDLWKFSLEVDNAFQFGVLVSERCNLKCIMCPLFSEDDNYSFKRERMPELRNKNLEIQVFEKFLNDISGHGKQTIRFSANGEPFMNPDFIRMLRLTRAKGHDIVINTNGLLMTSSIIAELAEIGINYLTFSIDGITEESYERVRIGGSFEKVISVLKECKRLKDEGRASWELQISYNELKELNFSRDDVCAFFRDKADNITFRKPLTDIRCSNFSGAKELDPKKYKYCFDIISHPFLEPNGNLVPCCVIANAMVAEKFPWLLSVQDMDVYDILKEYRSYAKRKDSEFNKFCTACSFWKHNYRLKGTYEDPIFHTVNLIGQ